MAQHYSDPDREDDTWSLPDIEVFYRTEMDNAADEWLDGDNEVLPKGWYYWFCMPGCLPDSDPQGPFQTAQEALDDAREQAEE